MLRPMAHGGRLDPPDAPLYETNPGLTGVGCMADRQNAFGYEELLAHGRGELPGQMDARLPAPPMLMFDRITHIESEGGAFGKGYVVAELDLHPDLWFFKCHFIGDPVMRG